MGIYLIFIGEVPEKEIIVRFFRVLANKKMIHEVTSIEEKAVDVETAVTLW